jgi:hypothetical protein
VRRLSLLVLVLALVASACGSGPSLTDYAAEIEAVVKSHNAGMDANDRDFESGPSTVERIRAYASTRMEFRDAFLAGFEALEPPEEVEELHAAALETIRTVVSAERELFNVATTSNDLTELQNLWASPAGQTARAADEKAVAICQAAEAAINSTEDRQALVGMPWVPSELQEIVTVAFGCTPADR